MTIEERLAQAYDVRVAFCSSSSFISKAIRLFSRGRASHAEITFSLPYLQRRETLSCDAGGVIIRPVEREEGIIAEFSPPPGVDLKAGFLEACKQLGARYDFGGLLGMAPVEIARSNGIELKNLAQADSAWFCSELTCLAMQLAGYDAARGLDCHSVDPEQLLKICEACHG